MKRAIAIVLLGLGLGHCGSAPQLYVHRLKLGKTASPEEGDQIAVKHLELEGVGAGQPGFYSIKSPEEWNSYWEGSGSNPPVPKIDFERRMILVGMTEASQSQSLKIKSAVETGTAFYAYVVETRPGQGCPLLATGNTKQDFVVVDRSDKAVHFYVEQAQASSCGDAPVAKIECKVQGSPVGSDLIGQPGQPVVCVAREDVKGIFAAVDHRWTFTDFPSGSSTKLVFEENGRRVKFTPDTFGRYGLRYEVADAASRTGNATASVTVNPSKDGLFVRVLWTNFTASDDPETFPRLDVEAKDPALGTCGSEGSKKTAWCELVKQGNSTQLRVLPPDGSFPMTVRYVDERFAGGPLACVRIYYKGAQTAELCDKEPRKAGEVWRLGAIVASNGTVDASYDDKAKKPATGPASAAPAAPKPPVAKKPAQPVAVAPAPQPKPPTPPATGKKKGSGIFNP